MLNLYLNISNQHAVCYNSLNLAIFSKDILSVYLCGKNSIYTNIPSHSTIHRGTTRKSAALSALKAIS